MQLNLYETKKPSGTKTEQLENIIVINTHAEFYVQQVHYHVDNLLSNLLLTIVPAIIKVFHSFFCIFFIAKLDIDIANKMVSKVITHIHFFNFTILKQQ